MNLHAARDTLQQAFNDAQLVPNAYARGQWWVDVGIEVSSPEGLCLQWVTARHDVLASIGLGISVQAAFNATRISCARWVVWIVFALCLPITSIDTIGISQGTSLA